MIRIVVLDKGWVLVGELEKDGNHYFLRKASFVRRWGTTSGLGQIASDGPTSETVLDKTPTVKFHESQMIFCITCNEEKWKLS